MILDSFARHRVEAAKIHAENKAKIPDFGLADAIYLHQPGAGK